MSNKNNTQTAPVNDPANVQTPPVNINYKSEAEKLMAEMGISAIYRTNDGQWFTKKDYADANAKKIGGTTKKYELEMKK